MSSKLTERIKVEKQKKKRRRDERIGADECKGVGEVKYAERLHSYRC